MNPLLYNVAEFKGFAIRKPLKTECEFLEIVLHDRCLVWPTANVTQRREQRLNLAKSALDLPLPPAGRTVGDDLADPVSEGEAISRFEGEGGRVDRALPAPRPSAPCSLWRTLLAEWRRILRPDAGNE